MKKTLSFALALALLLSLCACGSASGVEEAQTQTTLPAGTEANTQLLVGYSAVNITPEDSVPLAGYGRTLTRMSKGVLSYLYVTCTAITGTNGETILNYGMDIIGASDAYSFAPQVTRATGVPETNIIMSASHTHSCPDLGQEQLPAVAAFKQQLGAALVQAAEEAMADRAPAVMYIASVETQGLNFVRRYVMNDGTYAGDNYGSFSSGVKCHESEVDNVMQLIKFEREGKDIILANFQTHPHRTGGKAKYDISADIVGRFRDTLGAQLDCHVSYFTGGSGNVNPTSRIKEENIHEDWKAHGDAMAAAAMTAEYVQVEGTEVYATSTVYTATIDHTMDDRAAEAKKIRDYYNETGDWEGAMEMGKPHGILGAFHAGSIVSKSTQSQTRRISIFAHRVGNVGFVAAPYEMFDSNGMEIKEGSPFQMTFVCTCANGSNGYIPSKLGWEHGGYSVQTTKFVKGTAEELVSAYLGILNELYEK